MLLLLYIYMDKSPLFIAVGNLSSAIQMLSSLQKLLSAAQLQQLLNQNVTLSNQGII